MDDIQKIAPLLRGSPKIRQRYRAVLVKEPLIHLRDLKVSFSPSYYSVESGILSRLNESAASRA